MNLYHATSQDALISIINEGLRNLSYWSDDESVTDYYGETIEDEGAVLVVIAINLDALIKHVGELAIEPDYPGIEEPITGALGKSEDEINEEWEASDKSWRSSLEIIHSLRCRSPIPAHLLLVQDSQSEDLISIQDYLQNTSKHKIDCPLG